MDTSKMTDDSQRTRDPLYGINETLLRSEIGFWQEMIDCRDESMAPEALERMEQALALARSRLKKLSGKYQLAPAKKGHSHGNIYCLKDHPARA